jgi:regulator of sirC expression with transglutaminase-like and TPR domain
MMFEHVVTRDDDEFELDVAALLVAEWEYPNLDVAHYMEVLDGFADRVRETLAKVDNQPFAPVSALNRTLFGELGFRGDDEDYYDPRNSFIHEVVDRRLGIPISLSVMYMEVARRLDISIDGIGFPGHFLVRYDEGDESLIIDPYRMGLTLDSEDLQTLIEQFEGPDAELDPSVLQPVSNLQILMRMLTNLAAIYSKQGDAVRSVEVLERMRILDPDNPRVLRELYRLRQRATEVN